MIEIKTVLGVKNVNTSWNDITYRQYIDALELDNEAEKISKILGLSIIELANIDQDFIVSCLAFLEEDISEIEPLQFVNGTTILPSDIGEQSFEKKINAVDAVKESNVIELIKIYSGVDVSDYSCYDVFGMFNYLYAQVKAIVERENEFLKSNLTKRQINAGINEFDKLGEFNIIDQIARDYNYTHAEVEQLPYNTVFLILLKNKISTNFEQKYRELS